MKRFQASTSLTPSTGKITDARSGDTNSLLTLNYLYNTKSSHPNKVIDAMKDKPSANAARGSASSGYVSLDDTQSITSDEYGTISSYDNNKIFKSTGSDKLANTSNILQDQDATFIEPRNSNNKKSIVQTLDTSCHYSNILHSPTNLEIISHVHGVLKWRKMCKLTEMKCKELTRSLTEKDEELFSKECDIRQTKLMLQEEQRKVQKLEEQYDHLSGSLFIINNLLLEKGNVPENNQILEILEGLDIIGNLNYEQSAEDVKSIGTFAVEEKKESNSSVKELNNANSEILLLPAKHSSISRKIGRDDRQRSNKKSGNNVYSKRRHSVAASNCHASVGIEERNRRNSMVIRTTINLDARGETDEQSRIESIHFGNNNIEIKKRQRQLPDGCNLQSRKRYSIHLQKDRVNPTLHRRQSCNIPNPHQMDTVDGQRFCMFPEYHGKCNAGSSEEFAVCRDTSSVLNRIWDTPKTSKGKGSSFIKEHSFKKKGFIVNKKCYPCGNRIRLGKSGFKCADCSIVCHLECMHNVPLPCHFDALSTVTSHTPMRKYNNYFQSPPLLETSN